MQATHERRNEVAEDREYQGAPDYAGQKDEGEEVEAHAYKKVDDAEAREATEEPPDVEGHYHGSVEYTD